MVLGAHAGLWLCLGHTESGVGCGPTLHRQRNRHPSPAPQPPSLSPQERHQQLAVAMRTRLTVFKRSTGWNTWSGSCNEEPRAKSGGRPAQASTTTTLPARKRRHPALGRACQRRQGVPSRRFTSRRAAPSLLARRCRCVPFPTFYCRTWVPPVFVCWDCPTRRRTSLCSRWRRSLSRKPRCVIDAPENLSGHAAASKAIAASQAAGG